MAPPKTIDRDALHRVLWRRTDRRGSIKFVQQDMALELGISIAHFCRIMGEMSEEGRLRQVAAGKYNKKTYAIEDPEKWKAQSEQRASTTA